MNQSRTVRLPIHIVKDINACLRMARRMRQENEEGPTISAVAARLERSTADVQRLMELHQRVTIRAASSDDVVESLPGKGEAEPFRRAQKAAVNDIVDHWVCELGVKQ